MSIVGSPHVPQVAINSTSDHTPSAPSATASVMRTRVSARFAKREGVEAFREGEAAATLMVLFDVAGRRDVARAASTTLDCVVSERLCRWTKD